MLSQAVFLGQKLVAEGERDGDRLVQAMKASPPWPSPWPVSITCKRWTARPWNRCNTLRGTVLVALAGTWERLDLSTTLSRRTVT